MLCQRPGAAGKHLEAAATTKFAPSVEKEKVMVFEVGATGGFENRRDTKRRIQRDVLFGGGGEIKEKKRRSLYLVNRPKSS